MRRYLVVANQTLEGENLLAVVRDRSRGDASFFVLVPATPASGGFVWTESQANVLAHDRLERCLRRFAEMGVDAEGRVGDPDPLLAVQDLVRDQTFDEIILSTLPRQHSAWLKGKLPERLEAAVRMPVTQVVGAPEPETTVATLRRVPLLANLPSRRLRALAKAAVTRQYAEGEPIVRSGTKGSDLYVILDGRGSVRQDGRKVASLKAGDFFGEISLLDPGPRTADVVADAPTRCIRLAGAAFWEVVEDDPSLAKVLLRHLGRKLRGIVGSPAD